MLEFISSPSFGTIITILCFAIIKFNDLRHLEKDVQEIKEDLKAFETKQIETDKKQAVLETKIKTLEKNN